MILPFPNFPTPCSRGIHIPALLQNGHRADCSQRARQLGHHVIPLPEGLYPRVHVARALGCLPLAASCAGDAGLERLRSRGSRVSGGDGKGLGGAGGEVEGDAGGVSAVPLRCGRRRAKVDCIASPSL